MSMPFTLREAIDKAIPEIEKGTDSYGKAAKRLGIGKATVYRRHITLLAAEVARLEGRRGKIQTELKGLEKTYGDLEVKYREKHGILEGQYREKRSWLEGSYQKLEANLKGQIEKLNQEQAEIKSVFEAQGLGWNEGIQILKDVKDLRDERNSLQAKIARYTAELSDWEKEAKHSRATTLQLRDQLSDLRECVEKEEVGFKILLGQISSAENRLHTIKQRERDLWETVKGYEDIITIHEKKACITSLQSEIQTLTRKRELLSATETFLAGKVNHLKAEREEQIKKAKEAEKLAEQVGGLKKEKSVLEAEIETLKDDTEKLRKKPREISICLSPEQFSILEKIAPNGDVEGLVREQIMHVCMYGQS